MARRFPIKSLIRVEFQYFGIENKTEKLPMTKMSRKVVLHNNNNNAEKLLTNR